jgi:carbon-monoxide dehydrogenase large subunit
MAVARCPFPRARIEAVDVSAALGVEGVRHVLVGPEVYARTEPINCLRPVPGAPEIPYYALATTTAEYEGQPVVSVAATSRQVAEDAIDLIDVEYDPLPHVPDAIAAQQPDADPLHPGTLPTNLLASNPQAMGDPDAAFERADTVVADRFRINRVSGLPMEPRGILAQWRAADAELLVRMSTQSPHLVRNQLAHCLRIDEGGVQVSAPDVRGGRPAVRPARGRRRSSSGCSRGHSTASRNLRRSRTAASNARPGSAGPAWQ